MSIEQDTHATEHRNPMYKEDSIMADHSGQQSNNSHNLQRGHYPQLNAQHSDSKEFKNNAHTIKDAHKLSEDQALSLIVNRRNDLLEGNVKKDKEFNDKVTVDKKSKKDQSKGSHTIFIHKLYNMLEDTSIQHLIWWSVSNDSFFLIPSEEFCKVLLSYFKHSNVASFVRQLNMYGFHKVNDNNSSEKDKKDKNKDSSSSSTSMIPATKWEFAHSSKNFRKGDFNGLKNIKRRSSKNPNSSNLKDAHKHSNSEEGLKTVSEQKNLEDADMPGFNSESDNYSSTVAGNNPNNVTKNNNRDVNLYNSSHPPKNEDHPMLSMKLSELSYNLAAVRHEHARLQLQYDSAMDDLKRTNMDMVHLLDIVQKVATQAKQQPNELDAQKQQSPEEAKNNADAAQARGEKRTASSINLEYELATFRASIVQRTSIKDSFEQQPPYLGSGLQRSKFSSQDLSQKFLPKYNGSSIYEHDARHGSVSYPNLREGPAKHNTSARSESPFSSSADQHQPFKYVVSHHQQQQQQPPPPPQQQYGPRSSLPYAPQTKFPGQGNPFLNDVTFSSASSNRSRTMSILCDPLAPKPGFSTPSAHSPSTDSKHNSSVFSPEANRSHMRQNGYFSSISSSRTSEGTIPFAYQANPSIYASGAYPPYGEEQGMTKEEFLHKRHSSNDVLYDKSRTSESTNSQLTITFTSAPRSVPDIYNSVSGGPKHFAGRYNSTIGRIQDRPFPPPPPPHGAATGLLAPALSSLPASTSTGPVLPPLIHNSSLDSLVASVRDSDPPGVTPGTLSLPPHLRASTPGQSSLRPNSSKSSPQAQPSVSSGVYSLLNYDKKDVSQPKSLYASASGDDREPKRLKLDYQSGAPKCNERN